MKYIVTLFTSFLFLSCGLEKLSNETTVDVLGNISLDIIGNNESKEHFKKGLLLLHSFEFQDSEEAFLKAQIADPNCAMAYWGEAMTNNHPLWRQQNYDNGVRALLKLDQVDLTGISSLEEDLIQSVKVLYGEGGKFDRDEKYSEFMETLFEKYPDNQEIAAFYALSLLGSVHVGRNDEVFEKGARIAQSILEENPNHPGALHYLIHSYDDPKNAFKAIEAANSYSVVAKDASHALHMPSHIYVALGMWDEVVNSNIDSWEASVNRMNRKSLNNNAQSYHALYWLMYGYLQQGQYSKAEKIMNDMIQYTEELPSYGARGYIMNMKGTYLVETNDWTSEIASIDTKIEDLRVDVQGVQLFTQAMLAYNNKDLLKITSVIDSMKVIRISAETRISNKGIATCGYGQRNADPGQIDVDQLHVMEFEALALQAMLQNDNPTTKLRLEEATNLEGRISYSYGPPAIVKPSYELYGDWLLLQKNPEEATKMYELALERGPKRIHSLAGALECAILLEDIKKAEDIENELNTILHDSEIDKSTIARSI